MDDNYNIYDELAELRTQNILLKQDNEKLLNRIKTLEQSFYTLNKNFKKVIQNLIKMDSSIIKSRRQLKETEILDSIDIIVPICLD